MKFYVDGKDDKKQSAHPGRLKDRSRSTLIRAAGDENDTLEPLTRYHSKNGLKYKLFKPISISRKVMSSLYFGLDVLGLFEARVL